MVLAAPRRGVCGRIMADITTLPVSSEEDEG